MFSGIQTNSIPPLRAMIGCVSRAWLMLFSYFLGITTCFILLQLFVCKEKMGLHSLHHLKPNIYFRNTLYNSWGLLNEGESEEDLDRYEQCMEIYSHFHKNKPVDDDDRAPEKPTKKPSLKGKARKIFINCGGTFPWSIQLFLDTYPKSEEFKIFSFIRDSSYSVMYKKFPNHILLPVEASTKNDTINMDMKCFGCGYPASEKVVKLDIVHWIKTNTNKQDFVVLRVESDEETEIVKELLDQKLFDNIDKYYTTTKDRNFTESLKHELKTRSPYTVVQTWYVENQTYSDFLLANPKSIPIKGSLIDTCMDKNATEKFALFLYSNASTMNIFNVVNLLHQFSPKNMLPVTMFLPYQFYTSNWSDMQSLFDTFITGLYYSTVTYNHNSSQHSRRRELSLRNTAIAVQSVFKAHNSYMQSIMYHPAVDKASLQKVMVEYNYNFFSHGLDISNLTDVVLEGGTITMDMTGWEAGQYLMINIDTPHSEYLVLYMVRRFAPWLLEIFHCSVPMPGI